MWSERAIEAIPNEVDQVCAATYEEFVPCPFHGEDETNVCTCEERGEDFN